MDLTNITSIISNEFSSANDLYSLKLQNHIYGCFIIMEDIAQQHVDVSGTSIITSTPTYTFDFDTQFSEIGLRYGFAMDTKLALNECSNNYKETWIQYFKDIDLSHDINDVDRIEDCVIELLQKNVKPDNAYFLNVLETGYLSQEWINKAFTLMNPVTTINNVNKPLTKPVTKPVQKDKPTQKAENTRRVHPKNMTSIKKILAKTRRHKRT